MLLTGKPVLIVDHRVGQFVADLSAKLELLGMDVVVALDAAKASQHLKRFDFYACLIGSVADPAENYKKLIEELGGVPLLLYGAAQSYFSWLDKSAVASAEDVSGIAQVLEDLLESHDT